MDYWKINVGRDLVLSGLAVDWMGSNQNRACSQLLERGGVLANNCLAKASIDQMSVVLP